MKWLLSDKRLINEDYPDNPYISFNGFFGVGRKRQQNLFRQVEITANPKIHSSLSRISSSILHAHIARLDLIWLG